MGKYELEYISDALFEHMLVGMIFYTYPSTLSVDMVEQICTHVQISKLSPHVAIADLISYGIISVKIDYERNLNYIITEFGKYFFDKVCQTNADAREKKKKIRGYIS